MSRPKIVRNPFVPLVPIAGVIFAVSAWLYYVVTIRATSSREQAASEVSEDFLSVLFREHGVAVLSVELVLLAIGTVGAIVFDRYRRRGRKRECRPPDNRQ
jgi:hypothetical protein